MRFWLIWLRISRKQSYFLRQVPLQVNRFPVVHEVSQVLTAPTLFLLHLQVQLSQEQALSCQPPLKCWPPELLTLLMLPPRPPCPAWGSCQLPWQGSPVLQKPSYRRKGCLWLLCLLGSDRFILFWLHEDPENKPLWKQMGHSGGIFQFLWSFIHSTNIYWASTLCQALW